ncbi:MAG: methionine adenosyltransferase [Patescibacteria group bacterium]
MNIFVSQKEFNLDCEVVERKGIGHPDTLADALAEYLSVKYSLYTQDAFGAVLHHNFDKVALLGGSSSVSFGKGYMTSPIKVLVNGRVSTKFGGVTIPFRRLLRVWVEEFFSKKLPIIDPREDLEIDLNISNQSSPGRVYEGESKRSARSRWFEPESLEDLPELEKLFSNDTSLGVGYAPRSKLEQLVLDVEGFVTSEKYRSRNKWVGTDVKVMVVRSKDAYYLTVCVPQIANFVPSLEDYKKNVAKVRSDLESLISRHKIDNFELSLNTRDNYDLVELYLTATGSSLESGDEGIAGRGNRVNGVISPSRPMSMEGSFGKNPVYHIGKVYYLAAFDLANKIYEKFDIPTEVFLISQSGRDLLDPWIVLVNVPADFKDVSRLEELVKSQVRNIPTITARVLEGNISG